MRHLASQVAVFIFIACLSLGSNSIATAQQTAVQATAEPTAPPVVAKGPKLAQKPGNERPQKDCPPESANKVTFELTYAQRVLVPRGSSVEVVVTDASRKAVARCKVKTAKDAPPYKVVVPIGAAAVFPLQVEASLKSSIGQKFSNRIQLAEAVESAKPVAISLNIE
jgi:hypothetical protein